MIKSAYSVSFLLSMNIFVWQNVLYFLDAPRTIGELPEKDKNICKIVGPPGFVLDSRAPVIFIGFPPFPLSLSSAPIEIGVRTKFAVSVNVNWILDTAVDALCVASPALSPLGVRGSIWPQRSSAADILRAAASTINGLTLNKRFI